MKHIYFFLLFIITISANAQYTFIQVELVNADVGSPVGLSFNPSNQSNEAGLNAIFQNYNIQNYEVSYAFLMPSMFRKTTLITCDRCDTNQFIQDLLAYNSVIQYASLDSDIISGILNNGLTLKLVNSSVGISMGTTNGIATTNDTGLNAIFTNHGVRQYENTQIGTSYEKYELVCNCDANLLKEDLQAYNTVILSTENLYYGLLLSTEESGIEKAKIYPNPFRDNVNIETKSQIKTLELYNMLGKVVYKTTNISDFESFSGTLQSGVYILKLVGQQDKTSTQKLVKK